MLRWRAQHLAVEGLAWRAECQNGYDISDFAD
jgi:hypothetical protein